MRKQYEAFPGTLNGMYMSGVIQQSTPVTLVSLEVVTPPTTTEYVLEASASSIALNLSGMQVNAVYSDGSTKDVTSEIVTDPAVGSELEAGGHEIVISYSEGEATVLDTVNIKVYPDSPFAMNLEINPLPSKVGDTLDWSNVHANIGWMQDGLGNMTVSPPELTCDIELPYTFADTAPMDFMFTYSGKYGWAQSGTTIYISE